MGYTYSLLNCISTISGTAILSSARRGVTLLGYCLKSASVILTTWTCGPAALTTSCEKNT